MCLLSSTFGKTTLVIVIVHHTAQRPHHLNIRTSFSSSSVSSQNIWPIIMIFKTIHLPRCQTVAQIASKTSSGANQGRSPVSTACKWEQDEDFWLEKLWWLFQINIIGHFIYHFSRADVRTTKIEWLIVEFLVLGMGSVLFTYSRWGNSTRTHWVLFYGIIFSLLQCWHW